MVFFYRTNTINKRLKITQGGLCPWNLFIYKRTKKSLSNEKVPKHHERQETKALKNKENLCQKP